MSLYLLLDEPFAHLDAERTAAALAVLSDLAQDRQVIVFTTQSEAVVAPAGATVIELD